jgi:hypothetical protein
MSLGHAVRLTSVMALVLSMARVGYGQQREPVKPFHGLFGPTETEQMRPRQLDVNWSLYGAQDDNTFLSNETDILDATLQNDRMYSGASVSLAYTRRPPRKVLTVTAASSARYYPDLQRLVSTRYGGGVMFEVIPAERWTVQTTGSASYSPYYTVVLGTAPVSGLDLVGPSADYAASRQDSMTYGSYLGAKRTFSPTSSLSLSYGLRYMHFLGASQFADQRAGFRYTRAVSKSFSLNLGYQQSAVTPVRGSQQGGVFEERAVYGSNVDIGLGYNRTLFSSSRTTLSFASGTSTVTTADGSQFLVTGSARLMRQLTRLWTAQLFYDRGVQVPEGTTRPFFADTVNGSLAGYVNSRVMFRVLPSYSRGTVGVGALSNPYDSLSNTTRLEIALGRQVALYVEHFYYRYAFANNADLPPMLAGGLNRKGARVGLTLWTPVIR